MFLDTAGMSVCGHREGYPDPRSLQQQALQGVRDAASEGSLAVPQPPRDRARRERGREGRGRGKGRGKGKGMGNVSPIIYIYIYIYRGGEASGHRS